MVPAHRGMLKITFPTLSEALPSEYAGQGRDLNLQFSDVLRLQIRAYLICRLWFILIMIFAMAAGILNAIFNSPISLIPLALILGMWMLVTRMVMNRYGDLLQDYEALAQYRLSMLAQSLTNAGIQLKVGTAVYWIEVTPPPPLPSSSNSKSDLPHTSISPTPSSLSSPSPTLFSSLSPDLPLTEVQ